MSKKKKVILLVVILIFLIAGTVIIREATMTEKEKMIRYVENIDYDIKAYYIKNVIEPTGYASQHTSYLINIDKKIMYKIDDYYVYGDADKSEKGHNYKVSESKISDETINKLMRCIEEANDEGNLNKETSSKNLLDYVLGGNWVIEYKGKTIEIK